MASNLIVGSAVELSAGGTGVIRYVGDTLFQTGEWVGVELDDYTGKNDGSVKGERYFECEMGRGMFVRPSAVTVLEQPAPPPRKTSVASAASGPGGLKRTSRPSSVVAPAARRTGSVSDLAAAKRMSMNAASPSPAARLARPSSMLRVSPHLPFRVAHANIAS